MIDENERLAIRMFMAAFGGSLVALWALPWQAMSWAGRLFAVCVSLAFGGFGAPAIAAVMTKPWGLDISSPDIQAGIHFFGAALGLFLMPAIQKKAKKMLGLDKEDDA